DPSGNQIWKYTRQIYILNSMPQWITKACGGFTLIAWDSHRASHHIKQNIPLRTQCHQHHAAEINRYSRPDKYTHHYREKHRGWKRCHDLDYRLEHICNSRIEPNP